MRRAKKEDKGTTNPKPFFQLLTIQDSYGTLEANKDHHDPFAPNLTHLDQSGPSWTIWDSPNVTFFTQAGFWAGHFYPKKFVVLDNTRFATEQRK